MDRRSGVLLMHGTNSNTTMVDPQTGQTSNQALRSAFLSEHLVGRPKIVFGICAKSSEGVQVGQEIQTIWRG